MLNAGTLLLVSNDNTIYNHNQPALATLAYKLVLRKSNPFCPASPETGYKCVHLKSPKKAGEFSWGALELQRPEIS